MAVHRGAGAGGNDDGQLAGEDVGAVFGDFARGAPIAGVEGGLAAAGLVFGELDGDAEVFEHFDGGAGDVIVEGIAEAGAHQEHAFAEWAGSGIGHGEFAFPKARGSKFRRNPESGFSADFSGV